MTDGELKKQIKAWKSAVLNPYILTDTVYEIVDEAKKDLFEPMIILEAIDKPHANDYVYTYQKLQDRLIKWFGDST